MDPQTPPEPPDDTPVSEETARPIIELDTPGHTLFASPLARWFFAALFLFICYVSFLLIQPFLIEIFLAFVLYSVGRPVYRAVLRLVRQPVVASVVTCLVLILLILIPVASMVGIVVDQALDIYGRMSQVFGLNQFTHFFWVDHSWLADWVWVQQILERIEAWFGVDPVQVINFLANTAGQVAQFIYSNLLKIVGQVSSLVFGTIFILFIAFYLFRDGDQLMDSVAELSPMGPEFGREILGDIIRTIQVTMRGTILLALYQGVMGGIGFWIFGQAGPAFWGAIMVVASVIPVVGTAIVYAPVGVFLFLTGSPYTAIGLMVFCLSASLVGDYVIRPRILAGRVALHPLMVFFAVVGGLQLFGVLGLILGPLILSFLLSLIEIYRKHFL
ncbi:MAG: AI-2E family transporter [Proteobacteria bacterium]|nr:AI-2E family transporter [Pseudomonadota bacterium]